MFCYFILLKLYICNVKFLTLFTALCVNFYLTLIPLYVFVLFYSPSLKAKDKEDSKDIRVEIKDYISHHLKGFLRF